VVQVSTDDGATWTSLGNANTTSEHHPRAHPDVAAELPGLTGWSGGWAGQSFDLSAYAGQRILLARYVTDWASEGNGRLPKPGFYVDDVAVSETGFSTDGGTFGPFGSMERVSAEGLVELERFLHDQSLAEVLMIVSAAPAAGTGRAVPFSSVVERQMGVGPHLSGQARTASPARPGWPPGTACAPAA
jgi:hypothetical protein